MKLTKKDYFFIGLSIVSLLAHACLLPGMPDIVPTHWGFDGTVNGYFNKYVTLFLAALPCILFFFMKLLPYIDPRKKSYTLHKKAFDIFIYTMTLFLICLTWATDAVIFGLPGADRAGGSRGRGNSLSGHRQLYAAASHQLHHGNQDALDPGK